MKKWNNFEINLSNRVHVSSKAIVRWLVGFTVFIVFGVFFYLFYNVIYVKELNKIIIGFVIFVLTFVSEKYIFKKIHMSNLFIQFIKRGVLYFFIINICVFILMAFEVDIFNLIVLRRSDGLDDVSNDNQQSQSNNSTQASQSTSSTHETTIEKVFNTAKEISSNVAKFGENYIPYSVGGTIGAATMKYSSGAPLNQRVIATTAATALAVAGAGIAGAGVKFLHGARDKHVAEARLEDFKRLEDNKRLEEINSTGGSGHSGSDSNFTANSPLDSGEMENPLIEILDMLILYNVLELVFILLIMFIILNVILKNKLGLLLVNFVPSKFKKIHYIITKVNNSGRIDNIFIFVLLCMFLLVKVTGVYFINEIKDHIDDLVWLYNQTKK